MQFEITQPINHSKVLTFTGEFHRAERVALLGESGAGKTTLLRLLAGLMPLAKGQITIGGKQVVNGWQSKVTLVHQQPVMFAHHSVRQTIAYGGRYNRSVELPMQQWLEQLELSPLLDSSCAQLSGGQAQRVALVRALATGRPWLLLDEAFSAMDSARVIAACDIIAQYCEATGAGLVMASHQDAPQRFLCQSAYVIEQQQGRYEASVFTALDSQSTLKRLTTLSVTVQKPEFGFLSVILDDQTLFLPLPARWSEGPARVSIAASDISIAIGDEHQTSMVNRLQGRIVQISYQPDNRVFITLALASQTLMVTVSQWSFERLQLANGQRVFAEFKVGAVQWHGQA